MSQSYRLSATERKQLNEDGFLVREHVFTREECRRMIDHIEALERDLLAAKRKEKHVVGSYMFEIQQEMQAVVKWEPEFPDVIQGLEPFAHLSPALDSWARDPRLWEVARDMIGEPEIGLFTEKTTNKRAHTGGHIILHQDYPYWRNQNPVAHKVITAMIQLDDADRENGCLEVLPASHRDGWNRVTKKVDGFGANELDVDEFDLTKLVPVESGAGSVIFFGSFLIHRSLPNRSNRDRRALLYSYQPGGYPSGVEMNRLFAKRQAEEHAKVKEPAE